jgi:hypothetical protein
VKNLKYLILVVLKILLKKYVFDFDESCPNRPIKNRNRKAITKNVGEVVEIEWVTLMITSTAIFQFNSIKSIIIAPLLKYIIFFN